MSPDLRGAVVTRLRIFPLKSLPGIDGHFYRLAVDTRAPGQGRRCIRAGDRIRLIRAPAGAGLAAPARPRERPS